jgi:cyclopropane fatty-acyl-phospholipid synthase-like methyltransferase
MRMNPTEQPWWQAFFDDVYADMVLARTNDPIVPATVDFLMRRLHLKPGDVVFDQCCGVGGLSLPLARRGLKVIGVDQSAAYVRRATEAAHAEGLDCAFHVGDAFEFVPSVPCAATLNWATSFGYLADDQRNARMFRRAFESLAPGCSFALETINLPFLLRRFQASLVQRYTTQAGEWLLLRETCIDLARGMTLTDWTFLAPDGRRTLRQTETRMYLPHVLGEMLRSSGFGEVEYFGSIQGEPLGIDSPRCICVGRKRTPS